MIKKYLTNIYYNIISMNILIKIHYYFYISFLTKDMAKSI